MPADDAVQAVYAMAAKATKADADKKDAVQRGLTDQYHRVVRGTPELRVLAPLKAVRKQLSALAQERKRVEESGIPPEQVQIQTEQITAAMRHVAQGTLTWIGERLNPAPPQPAQPQQPPQPTDQPEGPADAPDAAPP